MTLWANLHGSFVLGLALLAPFGLEALLRARPERRLAAAAGWLLFGLAAAAAACLHPYGAGVLLAAARVLSLGEAQGIILEWKPQDFSAFGPFEAALLAGLGAALAAGLRLPLLRVLFLVGLLHMALAHQRHTTLLAVIGALVLAGPLARRLAPAPAAAADGRTGGLWPVAALGLALGAAALAAAALAGTARPTEAYAPRQALAAARAAGLDGPVLNHYDFGGFLLAEGVRTFIDGRTELYGGRFVAEAKAAFDLTDAEGLKALLERHRIAWTLLPPGTPAAAYLDLMPGWRRVHADPIAVVHARR